MADDQPTDDTASESEDAADEHKASAARGLIRGARRSLSRKKESRQDVAVPAVSEADAASPPPSPPSRSRRKIRPSFVFTVLALVGLAYLFVAFDYNDHRDTAAAVLSDVVGRPVTIAGDLRLELGLRPAMVARDVRVASADADAAPLVNVGHLAFRVGLWSLLLGDLDLRSVDIKDVTVRLERDAEGRPSWHMPELGQEALAADWDGGFSADNLRNLQAFEIRSLALALRAYPGAPRHQLVIESASLTAPPEMPVSLTGTMLADDDRYGLTLEGGPMTQLADPQAAWPLTLTLALEEGGADFRIEGSIADPVRLNGVDLRVRGTADRLDRLTPFTGLTLPPLPALDLDMTVVNDGAALALTPLRLRFGATVFEGSLRSAGTEAAVPGLLTLQGVAARAAWSDVRALLGEPPEGPWTDWAVPVPGPVDGAVNLRVDAITDGPVALAPVSLAARVVDGIITLETLQATAAQGAVELSGTLGMAEDGPRVQASLQVPESLDGGDVLRALEVAPGATAGVVSGLELTIDGAGETLGAVLANATFALQAEAWEAGADWALRLAHVAVNGDPETGVKATAKGALRKVPLDVLVTAGGLAPILGSGGTWPVEGMVTLGPGSGSPLRLTGSGRAVRPEIMDGLTMDLQLQGSRIAPLLEASGLPVVDSGAVALRGRLSRVEGTLTVDAVRGSLGKPGASRAVTMQDSGFVRAPDGSGTVTVNGTWGGEPLRLSLTSPDVLNLAQAAGAPVAGTITLADTGLDLEGTLGRTGGMLDVALLSTGALGMEQALDMALPWLSAVDVTAKANLGGGAVQVSSLVGSLNGEADPIRVTATDGSLTLGLDGAGALAIEGTAQGLGLDAATSWSTVQASGKASLGGLAVDMTATVNPETVDWRFLVEGPSLADVGTVVGVPLPAIPGVQFALDLTTARGEAAFIAIRDPALRFTEATGAVSVPLDGVTPAQGVLRFAQLDLAEVADVLATLGPTRAAQGLLPGSRIDLNADTIVRDTALVGTGTAAILVDDGVVRLDEILLRAGTGVLEATITVMPGEEPGTQRWLVTGLGRRVAGPAMTALLGWEDRFAGVVDVEMTLEASGASWHALASTADGRIGVALEGGSLETAVLEGWAPGLLDTLLPGQASEPVLHIACAVGGLLMENGEGTLKRGLLDSSRMTVGGVGWVNGFSRQLSMLLTPLTKSRDMRDASSPLTVSGAWQAPDVFTSAEDKARDMSWTTLGVRDPGPLSLASRASGRDVNPCVAATRPADEARDAVTGPTGVASGGPDLGYLFR